MPQVLVYLLQCAASSTPDGAELLLSVSNLGDQVEVAIGTSDQRLGQHQVVQPTVDTTSALAHVSLGPPITPSIVPGLRDPGLRNPEFRDSAVDALKLSVCRSVLEDHGAELSLGKPGEWESMFSFMLPVFDTSP